MQTAGPHTHTATPWKLSESGRSITTTADGRPIAMCEDYGITDEERKANAAHIVGCVNAWDSADALRARLAELERQS